MSLSATTSMVARSSRTKSSAFPLQAVSRHFAIGSAPTTFRAAALPGAIPAASGNLDMHVIDFETLLYGLFVDGPLQ